MAKGNEKKKKCRLKQDMCLLTAYILHCSIVQASQRYQLGPWHEAFRESSVIEQGGGWIDEKEEKHWDVRLTVLSKTDTETIIKPLEERRT